MTPPATEAPSPADCPSYAGVATAFAVCIAVLAQVPAKADVNGPGPSDPSLFDTVISLPPDPNISDYGSIGGVAGETTQLNVFQGGSVGSSFDAFAGSEVNINGGSVGPSFNASSSSEVNISGGSVNLLFQAQSGSVVNISGGSVGHAFRAYSGSEVNISGGSLDWGFDALPGSEVSITGGSVGNLFEAFEGSDVELFGGEFLLNGVGYASATITLSAGDVFTGTLSDGSAFVFAWDASDVLNGVTLTPTTLPALDTTPIVINSASPSRPSGLRVGQTLTLQEGGVLGDHFEVVDATLNITGGNLGESAGAVRSEVNITGGSIGSHFYALKGSVVNMSGGSVVSFNAHSGSEVNITGGSMGDYSDVFNHSTVRALNGSVVNMSGGSLDHFSAFSGSEVNVSGGSLGNDFSANPGSDVELIGGEFMLNGRGYAGSSITLSYDDILTGTLADGSAVIVTRDGTNFGDVKLTRVTLPTLDTTPIVINTALPTRPSGLRAGQALTLQEGGELGNNFEVVDATLDITGGVLGGSAGAIRSMVNINGGSVGDRFDAYPGSTVNITGGAVGYGFEAHDTSLVNISGGSVGDSFEAYAGSVVNISGGSVGRRFRALGGLVLLQLGIDVRSVVNISGGSVGSDFAAYYRSEVNISGGSVGDGFTSWNNSMVNISGGTVGSGFIANSDGYAGNGTDGVVNISGGIVGADFDAYPGSVVNISGGTVGDYFSARARSVVNLSGGSVGDYFNAYSGSEVNLFGTEFLIDGVTLTGLSFGEAYTLEDRDVVLTGVLADGTAFQFELPASKTADGSFFDTGATLTLTLVTVGLPGDFNGDGIVDAADYTVWRDAEGKAVALINETVTPGLATPEDYAVWVSNFGATAGDSLTATPEPTAMTVSLIAAATGWLACPQRQRGLA